MTPKSTLRTTALAALFVLAFATPRAVTESVADRDYTFFEPMTERQLNFTKPIEDRNLSFTISGKIDKVLLKRGETVEKDQLLVQLEAKEAKAAVDQLKVQVQIAKLNIDAARETAELAEAEFENHKQLRETNSASPIEYERSRIQFELSKIEQSTANEQRRNRELELKRAKATYERYALRAPIAGRIEDVVVSEGETVEPHQQVILLVVTNPLKVDAKVNIAEAMKLKLGDKAWITASLPGFTEPMIGTITYKASVADAAAETLVIGVEAENPNGLPAGSNVSVEFTAPKPLAAARGPAE